MALYLGNQRVTPNMITAASGVTPSGTKLLTDTSLTDVSTYQYAQVSDGNLVAGNIKKGVSILGITGTLEETTPVSGTLQITSNGTFDVSDKQYAEVNVAARLSNPKTVTPSATSQTVLPDQGDDGLSQVTVSGDSNLLAGNIKKDVSIFGVTGTLESGSGSGGSSSKLLKVISRDTDFSLTADDLAGLTSIGNSAFYNCSRLKSITIPDSVTIIGESAFRSCNYLRSITIPDSVTRISRETFGGCSRLTNVTIGNGVTNIEANAFAWCSGLPSITIPNNVTSIGERAFYDCFELTSITLPDSLLKISTSLFYGCEKLKNIIIPDSVTDIGIKAFQGCTGLTSITIPNNVTRIDYCAFQGCTGLTGVTIGSGMGRIGDSAFKGCAAITSIECHNPTPPLITSSTFDSSIVSNTGFVITVPAGTGNAYKAADGWSQFADKIVESTEF